MKRFMDFMKHSYGSYYIQLPDGETVEATREECFAPSYDANQRWYWDEEQFTVAIRLQATPEGKATGNAHLASLRKEERYRDWRLGCIWKGQPECRQKCSMCGYCDWTSPDDCLDCEQKCIECTLDHKSRTIEMDMFWNGDGAEENGSQWEFFSDVDIEREYEEQEKLEALETALGELSDDERQLWDYLADGMTERDIAKILGMTQTGINYRSSKLLKKLSANPAIAGFRED